jgi:DNA-binding transcriptional LysR family regulator
MQGSEFAEPSIFLAVARWRSFSKAAIERRAPGLRLDIVATDRLIDIVEEGFDARIRFGERLSQDMVAMGIKPSLRFAGVGSPAYLKGRKKPARPPI